MKLSFFFSLFFLVGQYLSSDISNNANGGPIQSWFLSPSTLGTTNEAVYTVYDESLDPDCIYVFGGYQCQTCMECYNVTDNTITTSFDILHSGGYSWGQKGAVLIDGIIYFINQNGEVNTYDIIDKQESTTPLFSIDSTNDGCLVKHPNNQQLYLLRGSATTTFYIYDFENDTLSTGPLLQKTRTDPSCVVNEYATDPYLYVFGGGRSQIERLNLNAMELGWELLSLRLDDNYFSDGSSLNGDSDGRLMGVASFYNYIYLIAGYDGSAEDDIYYLDVENWQLHFAGTYPLTAYRVGTIWCPKTKRIYGFGGWNSGTTGYSSIYYSNQAFFIPTLMPTLYPTVSISTTNHAYDTTRAMETTTNAIDTTSMPISVSTTRKNVNADTTTTTQRMHTTGVSHAISTTETSAAETTTISTTQISSTIDVGNAIVSTSTATPSTTTTNINVNTINDAASTKEEIADMTIVIIALSAVVSVCCLVFLCIFGVSMCYCHKRDRQNMIYKMANISGGNDVYTRDVEVELGQQLKNNNGNKVARRGVSSSSRAPSRVERIVSSSGINGETGMSVDNYNAGSRKDEIKLDDYNNDIDHDLDADDLTLYVAPAGGKGQLQHVQQPRVHGDARGNNSNIAKRHDNISQQIKSKNSSNNNNNNNRNSNGNANVAKITVDGKNIEIDYKDLINILSNKANDANVDDDGNGNDTTMISGENISFEA